MFPGLLDPSFPAGSICCVLSKLYSLFYNNILELPNYYLLDWPRIFYIQTLSAPPYVMRVAVYSRICLNQLTKKCIIFVCIAPLV